MNRILVAEGKGFSKTALRLLSDRAHVEVDDLDRDQLISQVKDFDVLWVRLRHKVDTEIFNAGPRIRILVSATTGLNHVDLDEANRRGINVISLRGETEFLQDIRATAEHTIALILSLLRHIPSAAKHVIEGGWNRDAFKGSELYGKTAGVIGYGRLGKIVSRYLRGLGMQVLTTDPAVNKSDVEEGINIVPLSDLLSRADVVTLHVNYTESNARFFGREEFLQMKRSALFINTSRGELVDEKALLNALQKGLIAGAALDVLDSESSTGMGHHPLVEYARGYDNLLITPHIGGCTVESLEKTEIFMAKKLVAALNALHPEVSIISEAE